MSASAGPSRARTHAARLVGALLVAVGALALYLGVDQAALGAASTSWPAVEGRITRSGVERVTSASTPGSRAGQSVTFVASLGYEYRVANAGYTGSRISYRHYDTEREEDARAVTARYPAGAAVKVFYDPARPAESVLERGSGGAPWIYAGLGVALMLAGAALFLLAPRLAGPPAPGVVT